MSCGTGDCSTCGVSETSCASSVFDWLYQIDSKNSNHQQLIEVQFKGDRKVFILTLKTLSLKGL